jgi:hypothetical protein
VVTITVMPVDAGEIENTAVAACDDPEPDPDPNPNEWTLILTGYAYTMVFHDDYGRSYACMNEITGEWQWTAQDPRMGVFVLSGDGTVVVHTGIMYFQALSGTPWIMSLKYHTRYNRAWGYFQYLQYRIKSALFDLNTTNNPPFLCDIAPIVMEE